MPRSPAQLWGFFNWVALEFGSGADNCGTQDCHPKGADPSLLCEEPRQSKDIPRGTKRDAMSKLFTVCTPLAFAVIVGLLSTAASARVGDACSGNAGCGGNEFCQFPTGVCSSADKTGHCAAAPDICAMVYQPVCGCNGQTFSNDCARRQAKVSKKHDGGCL
jgi:hypothetical protein